MTILRSPAGSATARCACCTTPASWAWASSLLFCLRCGCEVGEFYGALRILNCWACWRLRSCIALLSNSLRAQCWLFVGSMLDCWPLPSFCGRMEMLPPAALKAALSEYAVAIRRRGATEETSHRHLRWSRYPPHLQWEPNFLRRAGAPLSAARA